MTGISVRAPLVIGAVALVAGGGGIAFADWQVTDGTTGPATMSLGAVQIPTASTATAVADDGRVTVTWRAADLAGKPAGEYEIVRYDAGGGRHAALGGCGARVRATRCVEANAPIGTWRYAVRVAQGRYWVGPEGERSAPVTVTAESRPTSPGTQSGPGAAGAVSPGTGAPGATTPGTAPSGTGPSGAGTPSAGPSTATPSAGGTPSGGASSSGAPGGALGSTTDTDTG